ncbi:hypothetical protein ACQUY5_16765 [Bacillus cereus]|uniref:hypothetical protein n=1 Tax=Bacillus cereus TaxID=1396 RepID=UPI003D167C96
MLNVEIRYIGETSIVRTIEILDETGEQIAYFKSKSVLDEFCKKTGMVLDGGVVVEENRVVKEVMHKTNRTVQINHVDYSNFDPKGKVHIRGTKGSSVVDMYIHVEGDVIHITKPILLTDVKSYHKTEGNYFEFRERYGSFYFVRKPQRRRKKKSSVR